MRRLLHQRWTVKHATGLLLILFVIFSAICSIERACAATEKYYGGQPYETEQRFTVGEIYFNTPEQLLGHANVPYAKVVHPLFRGADSIDFTFGVLPDTQFYSKSHPDIFKQMNRWFVENRRALNLKYIFHLGDMVNNFDSSAQWEAANRAMQILDNARLPYGVVAGNHDVGRRNSYGAYRHYFGQERFARNSWYGGSYRNNKGHFDLIEANGRKYVMLAMGWDIGGKEVSWMNRILKRYGERTAVLYVHDYLNSRGKRTAQGQMLFERVVRPNKNIRLVLNGHSFGAARRTDRLDDDLDGRPDRRVVQLLSDYQSIHGGQGYIRVMGFDLTRGRVYVRTYSPKTGRTNGFGKSQDNFSFRIDGGQ